jgi:3-hydroxyisobutyrate dehydrogenase
MTSKVFNITVLGLGAMGSRMAVNLIKAGHRVTVWNRSPAPVEALQVLGAKNGATPREAVQAADFVVSMVRDDVASRHVWTAPDTGAIWGMQPLAIAIDSSTLTPAWTRELAQLCEAHKLRFLEAPVAGSRPQADAGQLIYFVGGDPSALAEAESTLNAMGGAIHRTGQVGSAAVVKLIVNAMLGAQVAAMAELLGMASKTGIDTAKALEIFSATPVASPAAKVAGMAMLAGNFAPMFPIDLVRKDFGYLIETGRSVTAELPISQCTHTVLENAIGHNLQNSNITALAQLYMHS